MSTNKLVTIKYDKTFYEKKILKQVFFEKNNIRNLTISEGFRSEGSGFRI